MPPFRAARMAIAAVPLVAGTARADVIGPFAFTISQSASRLDANTSCSVSATGVATGNYNASSNPAGTRTMPGLAGPFGPTDNQAVPIVFAGELGDVIHPAVSGGFQLAVDPAAGTLGLSGLWANLLATPANPSGASVLFFTSDGFRTRNPDLDYPGGSPLQLPLVTGTLTTLGISQVGAATGTLTPGSGPGEWQYSVTTMVNFAAAYTYLGQSFSAPAQAALPLELGGVLRVNGNTATLTSVQAAILSNSVTMSYQQPQFGFDLTQVSTPDQTAHLLLDLLVSNVTAGFNGELTLNADGVLVPCPGTLALLGVGALAVRRRR